MSSFGDLNRVNTNIQSMDARFSLNKITRDLSQNQLRLSTGLRINRAEDDAAGFSIASKLSSRIAGLDQALANVGDAKSVLDIAESSINNVMDILIEMKAKGVQAANDTLGDEERGFIEDQIESLGKEINKIADQTVFQDSKLLLGEDAMDGATVVGASGGGNFSMTFQVGERSSDTLQVDLGAVTTSELFKGVTGVVSGTAGDLTGGGGEFLLTPSAGTTFESTTMASSTSSDHFNLVDASTTDASAAATAGTFRNFIDMVDDAITNLSGQINDIGIIQSSLSIREETLSQQITSNSGAKSRIMDADFAKEQSQSIRLQILQQTATSALSQANMGPQSVLNFIQ